MPTASLDDAELTYRLDGPETAPVVMLSNSLGTTLDMWEPQIAALSERFCVLRYDTRGHGRSAGALASLTVDHLARDALGLLGHLGVERAHICGLSLGGLTGQALALGAPDRIISLTLANTSAHIPSAEMWNKRIESVLAGGMSAISAPVLERWFTAGFRMDNPACFGRMQDMLNSIPPEGYAAACRAVRDADFRSRVAQIKTPTLVLYAEQDQATPPAMARHLAVEIPSARVVALAPAAHISNVEQPLAFTQALIDHLRRSAPVWRHDHEPTLHHLCRDHRIAAAKVRQPSRPDHGGGANRVDPPGV